MSRTVNIAVCKNYLASYCPKLLKSDSYYKFLIRLFSAKLLGTLTMGVLLLALAFLPRLPDLLYLAIDRTNWEMGDKKINILVIGIVLPGKIFIPIAFNLLDKKGNSKSRGTKFVVKHLFRHLAKSHKFTLSASFYIRGG